MKDFSEVLLIPALKRYTGNDCSFIIVALLDVSGVREAACTVCDELW